MKLHNLDFMMVQADIRTYLKYAFTEIRDSNTGSTYNGWPASDDLDHLVQLSGTLFIVAATAVRFVTRRKYSPQERMDALLRRSQQATPNSTYPALDQLYTQVLQDAVQTSDDDEEILCDRLRTVVGVVVVAQHPLSLDALADLLDIRREIVEVTIHSVSAVLLVEEKEPVRVFHPSFPDFITTSLRCNDTRFNISPSKHHSALAHQNLTRSTGPSWRAL
jgi:hypothetical protein